MVFIRVWGQERIEFSLTGRGIETRWRIAIAAKTAFVDEAHRLFFSVPRADDHLLAFEIVEESGTMPDVSIGSTTHGTDKE